MTEKIFLGVDHVVIRTEDSQLFELLSGPLSLPITWPLERAAFATFGWIGVGNTNLEIWAATDNSDLPADCRLPLIQQIALSPADLSASLAHLEAAGVKCKEPRSYQSKDALGELRTNFTNSVILDLSSDECCVFFCDWDAHAPIVPWRKGITTHERRQGERKALAACNGGALGVVGLQKIAMQTRNLEVSKKKWRTLTGIATSPFTPANDITLQLSAGSRDGIESLTFEVRDLSAAREFLQSKNLLAVLPAGDVALARSATGSVSFRFI